MAKFVKKNDVAEDVAEEAVVEAVAKNEAENAEESAESGEYPSPINEDEVSALNESNDTGAISTQKMNKVLEMLSKEFNLEGKNFVVQSYKDNGIKVTMSLGNDAYDIVFTAKNLVEKGIDL